MTATISLFRRGAGVAGAPAPATPSPAAVVHAAAHAGATSRPRAGAIRFEQVGKTYQSAGGAVQALRDIDLDIPAGTIFGIIGRSGAGKSSLLRTINGLETPTRGHVRVDGVDVATLSGPALVALRRRIGMIFQHFNLLSAKTVWDNVALPLKVAGVPRAEITARVASVLQLVGLEHKAHSYPGRLSGGQKQRVGIARALVHRPDILLCDEATSALDPETTHAILKLLRDIQQQLGITIVLITHEMRVIREICDTVLVLEQGAIAETGPVWQVFGEPGHDATRALLAPLHAPLADDLHLHPAPDGPGAWHRVLELRVTGRGAAPDFLQLSSLLGGGVRLLQGGVDRIQGHTQGTLRVAVPVATAGAHADFTSAVTNVDSADSADTPAITSLPGIHITELGYVSHPD